MSLPLCLDRPSAFHSSTLSVASTGQMNQGLPPPERLQPGVLGKHPGLVTCCPGLPSADGERPVAAMAGPVRPLAESNDRGRPLRMDWVGWRKLGRCFAVHLRRMGDWDGPSATNGREARANGVGHHTPGRRMAGASFDERYAGRKAPQQGSFGRTTLPSLGVPRVSVASWVWRKPV